MRKREGFTDQIMFVLPKDIVKDLVYNDITKGLYLTDIGYYPSARHHYRERKTGALQNILIYCRGGEGWFEIDGRRRTVRQNQYFTIAAGVPHKYGAHAGNPWTIYWVHFTGRLAQRLVSRFHVVHDLEETPDERSAARIRLFEEIFHNLEMGYSPENLEYACICLRQLLASFKYLSQFQRVGEPVPTDVATRAVNFVKEQLDRRITLAELAAHCDLSISHFSLVFRRTTGRSPMDYLTQLRIQRACNLLDFSGMKVKDVAARVGFDDVFYFSRVFRRVMGQSPSAYRKVKKG